MKALDRKGKSQENLNESLCVPLFRGGGNQMNKMRSILIVAVALVLIMGTAAQAEKKAFKIGVLQWTDLMLPSAIVTDVLEQRFGYKITQVEFFEWGIAYAALAKGDIDVLAAQVNYVSHDYWKRSKEKLEKLSPFCYGLYQGLVVPTYVPLESIEELNAHPDWSFHGKDYPSDRELQEARFRMLARHPKTTFLVLHVGNAENLGYISEALDRYPNMLVEFGARIGELGRQPRTARKFFDKHQDRILFGTDAVPHGEDVPQQIFCDELYEIYCRFLETEDEYFDYAPAPVPPQGRWRIYGLGLPESILRKVYWENAARLLGLSASA